MKSSATSRTETGPDSAKLESMRSEIRLHLEGLRRALAAEIRDYPTPIPRCDAQFNHLYEQQARLARDLDRIGAFAEEKPGREDYIELVGRFIASAPYTDDAAERELRSRMKKQLSAFKVEKIHSWELGLLLARQLLGVEDLHYGLWDADLELKLCNLAAAQQRYNDMLLAQLPRPERELRVLDVGCGTGQLLRQMLDRGYSADGVIPSKDLGDAVRRKLADRSGYRSRIFEGRFEDFPVEQCRRRYDVTLFSESFQYISTSVSLPILQEILKPGGLLLISDFFKNDAPESASLDPGFGGGHPLREFYASMKRTPFVLVKDEDITRRVSPNMELVNDLLMNRIKPATLAIGRYVGGRYPLLSRLALRLLRKRLEKLNHKYFSGHRSKEVFERYKSYRVLLYSLP